MGPESILLQVVRGGREGTYRFDCPTCMESVEKRADRKIVALLVSAGVDVAGRGASGTSELFEESDADVDDPRLEVVEGRVRAAGQGQLGVHAMHLHEIDSVILAGRPVALVAHDLAGHVLGRANRR